MSTLTLVIGKDGTMRHLSDDATDAFADGLGTVSDVRRASRVEVWRDLPEETKAKMVKPAHQAHTGDIVLIDGKPWQKGIGPVANAFWCDLSPSKGPVFGPYKSRARAVAVEHAWLAEHGMPLPTEEA